MKSIQPILEDIKCKLSCMKGNHQYMVMTGITCDKKLIIYECLGCHNFYIMKFSNNSSLHRKCRWIKTNAFNYAKYKKFMDSLPNLYNIGIINIEMD